MYGNRTVCGIGRGDSAMRVRAASPTPWPGSASAMHVIRELGRGREAVDVDGHVDPDPVGPAGREAAGLDGRVRAQGAGADGPQADGFILQLADPYLTEWMVKSVRAAAEAAGRDPAAVTICVAAPAYVTATTRRAWPTPASSAAGSAAWSATTSPTWSPATASTRPRCPTELTDVHQGPRGLRLQPPRPGRQPDTTFVPDEIVDRFCLIGPPRHSREAARAARAGRRPVRRLRDARRQGGDDRRVRERR